ncbi:MAG: outer membrane beta-barrel protein, partial [Prevotella sp.]
TLDFDNGSRSFNKPMWVFNANNAFRLKHNWQLELNSEFHSKASYSNVELTCNFWSLNASIQKSLLKNNALTLRLSCNDIFKRGNNNVFIDYGSYNIYQTNIMDYHRVVFTARYSFNATRSKYKGTGAGQDVKSRLGGQNNK